MEIAHCLLIFVVGVALTEALRPGAGNKICCLPRSWEGFEGVIVGYSAGRKQGIDEGRIKVAYDADHQRIAAKVHMWVHHKLHEVCILQDYANKEEYISIKSLHECVEKPLGEFKQQCLTDDVARHYGSIQMGYGDDTFVAEEFGVWNPKVPHIFASVTMLFSGKDEEGVPVCVPVAEVVSGSTGHKPRNNTLTFNRGEVHFLEMVGFTNMTEGISDPTVFQKPGFCNIAGKPSILSQKDYGTRSLFGF